MFQLECFDEKTGEKPRHHPEFSRGYIEGVEAGRAEFSSEQLAMSGEIVTAFSDAIFTYAEARQALLSELEPILRAIPKRILPSLVEAGLATKIEDILTTVVSNAASLKPTVLVHPAMYKVLSQAEVGLDLELFNLAEDPNVPEFAAWLRAADIDIAIDFENIVAAISAVLENYIPLSPRKILNGPIR